MFFYFPKQEILGKVFVILAPSIMYQSLRDRLAYTQVTIFIFSTIS